MDKNIGKKLDGRYEIMELIGIGGMADVYKATDLVDNKTVAVKILKNEFSNDDDFLRRFRNESKAIAVLSHPNIVKIYDVGFTDKIQFIVMEYIDGITLKEFMEQQGILKWKDAIHFTIQVLKALQHAHDRGIVHRDIKPQNIMLFPDGTIKVMDFGIARFAREEGKTLSDKAIGSVHYISPEQARGEVTDEKSDIYSVGVMFYEMLTGQKPFDAENPVSVALMHMQTKPKMPRAINDTIPAGLEEIVMRAMQKEPSKRYQSASEMIKDIEEFKKNPSIVFEYRYMTPQNDGSTKYFKPVTPKGGNKKMPYYDDYDDDDDYDDYDDEDSHRPSLLISILTAITAAVIIIAAIFVTVIILDKFKTQDKIPTLNMPNLVGMDLNEAIQQYGDVLDIVESVREPSTFDKDTIFDQDKPVGMLVNEDSTVHVSVSNGPKQVPVPNIVGFDIMAARNQLTVEGLLCSVQREINDEITKDYVIRTIPDVSTPVPVGSEVIIVVSMGPEELDIKMPKFVGRTFEEIQAELENLKLQIKRVDVDSVEPEGYIVEQSIPEGEIVKPDTELILSVSTGVEPSQTLTLPVSIPDGVSGAYEFKAYINGTVISTITIDEMGYLDSPQVEMTISGSGLQTVTVGIKSLDTGRSATYAKYSVDFSTRKGTVITKDEEVFEFLNDRYGYIG